MEQNKEKKHIIHEGLLIIIIKMLRLLNKYTITRLLNSLLIYSLLLSELHKNDTAQSIYLFY